MYLLQAAMMICLVMICYQDLTFRAVYWWCFPLLAVLLALLKYQHTGLREMFSHAGYGIAFLGFQLAVLWLYFSVKNKRRSNLTNGYLGWGDVLFLAAIAFYLSPVNYILFYVGSLVVVLLYTLTGAVRGSKERNPTVPLAGLQAALFGLLMLADYATLKFTLYDDSWLFF